MRKKLYLYIMTTAGILLNACVSEFTPEISGDYSNLLVLEGSIVSDAVSTFYIGWTTELTTGKNKPAEDPYAIVTVVGEDGYESAQAKLTGNGVYELQTGSLDENIGYAVRVIVAGRQYQSDFRKPLATPPIDSLVYKQDVPYGEVDFRITTAQGSDTETYYYRWTCNEVWETTAAFYTMVFYDPNTLWYYVGEPNYYCWNYNQQHEILIASTEEYAGNQLVSHKLFAKEATDNRFSSLYRVTITQKRIPQDAYRYYQNKIKLNEDMGGLFSPQPAEIKSNIECTTDPSVKAIGFIDVLKNTSDYTLYIYQEEISQYADATCPFYTEPEVWAWVGSGQNSEVYRAGFRPIGRYKSGEVPEFDISGWVLERCMDCVVAGGTLNKPKDWIR